MARRWQGRDQGGRFFPRSPMSSKWQLSRICISQGRGRLGWIACDASPSCDRLFRFVIGSAPRIHPFDLSMVQDEIQCDGEIKNKKEKNHPTTHVGVLELGGG